MSQADAKQVIVLRKDLNMRKGKMVAQGAHASMAAILNQGVYRQAEGATVFELRLPQDSATARWLQGRFKKICVGVNSEDELLSLHEQALAAGLPCALIQDSGLTEFGGVATYTALAVGPADPAALDAITGKLGLL